MLSSLLKIKDLLLAVFIVILLVLVLSLGKTYKKSELAYGVTFSPKQARALGLDWRAAYLSVLDELGARKLRLVAYWDEVGGKQDEFFWDDVDWQLDKAAGWGAKVILAVGGRLPRWPECHFPDWAKNLDQKERQREILKYIEAAVRRYKDTPAIVAWQVENEPFLSSYFGKCPSVDRDFLDQEIALVKSLDSRPVVITDSGELSLWYEAANRADIFGTTMYRDTYSERFKGYVHYPIKPGFFKFKKHLVGLFARPRDWIVIELAAEPWGPVPYQKMSAAERDRTMSIAKFREMLEFGRQAGFREFYLWGAEWWYWEKTTQNNPVFWNEAKGLFNR